MFKKFTKEENVGSTTLVKASVGRGIRAKILEQYPELEDKIDHMLPKKGVQLVKCNNKVNIVQNSETDELLFFSSHDGPFIPTLRLLHKYPDLLPRMQADKGAIKFILNGADVMCPGLTSPGAKMCAADKGDIVSLYAEGKEHAMSICKMLMSSDDIQKKNKGIGLETIHCLNDGLWEMENGR